MLVVVFVGSFGGFVTVQAEENSEVTQEIFTVGMALPFTMLETYLYALAGEQAVSTYYENEENQEALHKDFCDFMGDTSSGIKMNMKINGFMATVTMGQLMEYYKTAGSSALAGANEETKNNLKVIIGGENPDSDNNGDSEDDKNVKIASATSTALVTEIANYIDELIKGNRGKISETFANGGQVAPDYYFDGDYVTIGNDMYIKVWGSMYDYTRYKLYKGLSEVRINNYTYGNYQRLSIYISDYANGTNYFGDGYKWHDLYIYGLKNGYVQHWGNIGYDVYHKCYINNEEVKHSTIIATTETLPCISQIPVFISRGALEHYLKTGDASGAINYFEGIEPKEEWYDFDFSAITGKLDELLKAFKNLPLITTDSLAGFAQGVNNGVVAGQLPQAEPNVQQHDIEKLIEDISKKVVSEQLADDTVNQTEEDLAEEFGATPKPTYTPEQNVTKKQAKMMVDLHEFFPFCVPYDLVHLIKVLNAEPVAPCFETALVYEPLNINISVKLDMAQFEDVAMVFRIIETALFILSLILVSRSLIRG